MLHSFSQQVGGSLVRQSLSTLQVNLGSLCNLACSHCHVEAGPNRLEQMSQETAQRVITFLHQYPLPKLDLTGGAPELVPCFRELVLAARGLEMQVIDRCNLTVLLVAGQGDLAEFLAQNQVEIVASLPCYSAQNVDKQRGQGVFGESIKALQLLNSLGYGKELTLNLVYNPGSAQLPPPQRQLEQDYRVRLAEDFGITFNNLYTITNMPIKRFRHYLEVTQQLDSYQMLLTQAYNPSTLAGLMCRHQISIDWEGRLYDCDFNQMLDLSIPGSRGKYLWDFKPQDFIQNPIALGNHCFGCTAGAGSSCGGALA